MQSFKIYFDLVFFKKAWFDILLSKLFLNFCPNNILLIIVWKWIIIRASWPYCLIAFFKFIRIVVLNITFFDFRSLLFNFFNCIQAFKVMKLQLLLFEIIFILKLLFCFGCWLSWMQWFCCVNFILLFWDLIWIGPLSLNVILLSLIQYITK